MTILFPGQGSQYVGMGESLFMKYPGLVEEANEVLGYSIQEICLNNYEKLRQTSYTQPAIFIVSVLMYLDFLEEWNYPYINFMIGHSLGEYTALYAAGALNFKTGVQLVKKRGELMQTVKNGTMAAVIGLDAGKVDAVLKKEQKNVTIANYNSGTQVVIAGNIDDINFFQPIFSSLDDVSYHILPVSGAFHSSYMTNAAQEFSNFLDSIHFNTPRLPVLANWNTKPYMHSNIKENLVKQIDHPVLWDSSIQKLIKMGETSFFETGPRNVLSKLIKSPVI